MILIDALYINYSGGLELLKYLVQTCEEKNLQCRYIIDKRCTQEFNFLSYEKVIFLNATLINRFNFYLKNRDRYSTILCFGNIPPTIKTSAVVYTYFHNIFLAKTPRSFNLKNRVLNRLKRLFIYFIKNNTNIWIVQTENTKNTFSNSFSVNKDVILVLPFYKINDIAKENNYCRTDYVYIANYNKGKNHDVLIDAWNILFDIGFNEILHLTLSENTPVYLMDKISKSRIKGVNIINHGYVKKDQVIDLYLMSKVTVYPSENESLGLGIVEAIENGCDLIAPDYDYVNSICIPSVSFKEIKPRDIVEAVLEYEDGKCQASKLKIKNSIDQLINLLK